MAIKPIEILIRAKDQFTGVFGSLQGKAAAVATAIAGYFGFSAFADAVRGASDLEAKLSEVQAVSNATAQEMELLRAAAEQAGATTKFTATEGADALGNLARAGLSARDAIAALPPVLQLAQAGGIGLGEASEYVTKTLSGFVLKADQAGRIADVLAAGANASNTSVTGLAQALSYAAPIAQSLGLSLETTVALVGKFADAGIDASRAGTALNAILSQFSDPASKFRQELAAAGITTTNFESAIRQLAKAGPAGQRAILAVGTEAGPALRALLNQGIGALDDLTRKLNSAGGSAAATAAVMENNLKGAANGLSSAWDSVKNTLATPVLPVLKDGVEQLARALQAAVSDGTVGRFGQALASAFQTGLDWARQFLGQVDFAALTQRMQVFATEAGSTFRQIGESARTAGDLVQIVYGLMSGGVNAVLTAVYGLGAAFARVAEGVTKGIALLREGFASITFGSFSKSIREAANDATETAAAFGAVAEAMEQKAVDSFNGMAEAALVARSGWGGLTESMRGTSEQASLSSRVVATVSNGLQAMGAAAAAAGDQVKETAAQQQKAFEESRVAVTKLREEYEKAIATGNVQLAAEKYRELKQATDAAASSAGNNKRAQEEAAAALGAAFERAGIQTKQALETIARVALEDFELIRSSGQATTDGLKTAWQKYAEAAIAANGGVASATIRAQAGMQGLEVVADSAGKSIVRAMSTGASSADGLTTAVQMTTEQLRAQEDALDRIAMKYKLSADYTERQIALLERENALIERRDELERKRRGVDKQGFALDKGGDTAVAGGDLTTLTGITAFLKSAGLNETAARQVAREFADSQGNVPYSNNPGQLKYGGANSTISQALLKAAERQTFGTGGPITGAQPIRAGGAEQARVVNINWNGAAVGPVNTDAAGEATIQRLVEQMRVAASRAS